MASERANGRTAAGRLPALAVVALALASLAFAGCLGGGGDETTPAKGDPMRLDLLVYNIEYSGDASTDKVIRQLDADVVGVLESYERLPEIDREDDRKGEQGARMDQRIATTAVARDGDCHPGRRYTWTVGCRHHTPG